VSGFFQSEIVRESIKEMEELQQKIIEDTFKAPLKKLQSFLGLMVIMSMSYFLKWKIL